MNTKNSINPEKGTVNGIDIHDIEKEYEYHPSVFTDNPRVDNAKFILSQLNPIERRIFIIYLEMDNKNDSHVFTGNIAKTAKFLNLHYATVHKIINGYKSSDGSIIPGIKQKLEKIKHDFLLY